MTRKKSRGFSKRVLMVVFIIFIFVVIVALAVYQNQLQAKKYTVEEYFDVTVAVEPWANDKVLNNGTSMIIHAIVVTVKAVEGDAHGVVIQSWARSESVSLGDIPKGELRRDYMVSPEGARVTRDTDGKFSVTLSIVSLETSGRITVRFQ